MKKNKLFLFGLGLVGLVGITAYSNYQKLLQYAITFNRIEVRTTKIDSVNFDLFVNFLNKSNLVLTVLSQQYFVYVNDTLIASITSNTAQKINPLAISVIKTNVIFNPTKVGKTIALEFLQGNTIKLNVKILFKVRISIFTITVPYIYTTTLKELFAKK